jgi:hypothetical protein
MPTFKEDAPDPELRRQAKGLAIVSMGSCIKRINKLRYRVQSQSDETKWYSVVKQYGHNIGGHKAGEWTCSCPDFVKFLSILFIVSTSLPIRRLRNAL